jgi:hypothetical protein
MFSVCSLFVKRRMRHRFALTAKLTLDFPALRG